MMMPGRFAGTLAAASEHRALPQPRQFAAMYGHDATPAAAWSVRDGLMVIYRAQPLPLQSSGMVNAGGF